MKLKTALLGAACAFALAPAAQAERGTDGEVRLTYPQAPIIQKAQFAACIGPAAPTCTDLHRPEQHAHRHRPVPGHRLYRQ